MFKMAKAEAMWDIQWTDWKGLDTDPNDLAAQWLAFPKDRTDDQSYYQQSCQALGTDSEERKQLLKADGLYALLQTLGFLNQSKGASTNG